MEDSVVCCAILDVAVVSTRARVTPLRAPLFGRHDNRFGPCDICRAMGRLTAVSQLGPRSVGAYVRGRCFAYAITSGRLHATLAWGVMDAAEARSMTSAWATTVGAPPHPSLFDASGMTAVDGAAFEMVRNYLALGAGRSGIERQAIVCSPGFGGAVVTGYFSSFPPPFGYQVLNAWRRPLPGLGGPLRHKTSTSSDKMPAARRIPRWRGCGPGLMCANLTAWTWRVLRAILASPPERCSGIWPQLAQASPAKLHRFGWPAPSA